MRNKNLRLISSGRFRQKKLVILAKIQWFQWKIIYANELWEVGEFKKIDPHGINMFELTKINIFLVWFTGNLGHEICGKNFWIFSGKYETQIANIHGYKDDDYTLWRLKEKQLKTLEDLHTRKTKFIVNEACRNRFIIFFGRLFPAERCATSFS